MNKKINLYYFGEIGAYDKYNPAYVCNNMFASEILYLIAKNKPFKISKQEIIKTLNIELNVFEEAINALKEIKMIEIKDCYYKVNFPIFLVEDLDVLDKLLTNIGTVIGEIFIENKQFIYSKLSSLSSYKYFSKERLLYHIICDYIFDGTAFDFFSEKDLFCVSKIQPGERDYIAIGYEDNEMVEIHSNKLLCSSNNFRSDNFVFNSFGDSNGQRKDMYRFFRMTQKSLEDTTKSQELNFAYIKIIDKYNRDFAKKCGELILKILSSNINYLELNECEKELAVFLKELNYISFDTNTSIMAITVPVFNGSDIEIVNEISTFILNELFDTVKELFIEFENNAKELTSIQHNVDIKEILNELWHQIFGITNEYLVEKEFIVAPKHINGEGRYFQSFSVNY